ncbi:MAG: homocysteine S-methyltransferase family protein [Candidatus Peribacteraceae bacterium]|nr:homocysteine S-methyltransferase family protein [Candidatus Peribacteraceae bacterium]MDD5739669.1 homocysteine S-methyltransferase family protein [Candidatus Peribacteraceae bacterium]
MDLGETLASGRILLLDGAMGTELDKHGLQGQSDVNQKHPGKVIAIHDAYLKAGAQAITTNTFLLNRLTHAAVRDKPDLDFLNRVGVALAREVAGKDHFVLGGMGPTGRVFDMDPLMNDGAVRAAYMAQAQVLAEEATDGLIIETMTSLREALLALDACREVTDKPVIVSMSYYTMNKGIRTLNGDRLSQCAQQLEDGGADSVGTNCSKFLMYQMAWVVMAMKTAVERVPIIAQPNAGQPHGEASTYDMIPEQFADGVELCIDAGATVVGGCCGAGPECIREVNERIKHL